MSTEQVDSELRQRLVRHLLSNHNGTDVENDPLEQLLREHAELTQRNRQRVQAYMGVERTPQGVQALMETILAAAYGAGDAQQMASELSFCAGVTLAYLQDYKKLLEAKK